MSPEEHISTREKKKKKKKRQKSVVRD